MGIWTKKTFFQRRYPNDPKDMKKCSISLIIRKMKSKPQWVITSQHTLVRMTIIKKSTNKKCWWRCGEKETLVHCWWEGKLVQPLLKTVWRFLKKLKTELPYDPAIALLGIYLKKIKTLIQKDTCTPMFIAALFRSEERRVGKECRSRWSP